MKLQEPISGSQIILCISYFFMTVIKIRWPRITEKRINLVYGSWGIRVHRGDEAQQLEQETERSHFQPQTQSREKTGSGVRLRTQSPPSVMHFLQQVCTASPDSTTNWRPSVKYLSLWVHFSFKLPYSLTSQGPLGPAPANHGQEQLQELPFCLYPKRNQDFEFY